VPVTLPASRPPSPTSRPRADRAAAASSFAQLGLPAALVAVLGQRGIVTPLPIQAATLPDALAGRDILGQAETGSGKTLAFGLPLLTRLAAAAAAGGAGKRTRQPRALVLVPTRELARQIHGDLAPLASAVGLRLLAVYGGAPLRSQIQALRRGIDVVVATPGRLTDLLNRGACSLDMVAVAVLDEADHMADLGFLPAVTWLLDRVPRGGQRLLFSATLDHDIDSLARRYLADPVRHTVAPAAAGVGRRMDHRFLSVAATDKVAVAAELAARPGRVLVFVRTKHGATRLARQLALAGVRAGALHGNLAQNARERTLAAFASGATPVLVATDIAARGLHVDGVDLVVHFDPPDGHKAYLHRSGRTARAGAAGSVVTLVLPGQAAEVAKLSQRAGVTNAAATLPGRSGSGSGSGAPPPLPSRPGSRHPRHRSRRRRSAAA